MAARGTHPVCLEKILQTRKSLSADLLSHLRVLCPVNLGACRAQFPWQLEPLNVNSRHHQAFQTIASKLEGGSLRSMHGMAVALESNAHLDLVAMDLRGGSLRVCNSLDVSHACICPVFTEAATNPE
ncbi:unnamed protein product [Polarella glacialis]|uniref:Uncharacterized protein n=1 Tax=Polarella glacialis TaxID=89957 RepID=A0A813IT59_POLGL|nr:unnamed protein product [Polarella glacialis]CAE8655194.1 unnamed protein product [Polarella glacialis]